MLILGLVDNALSFNLIYTFERNDDVELHIMICLQICTEPTNFSLTCLPK